MIKINLQCPSSVCKDGANLLGFLQENGRFCFSQDKFPIDNKFVQIARTGRIPEKRFRFSNTCVKGACNQWTGNACGVIDKLITISDIQNDPTPLPKCSIRNECRWYSQCGARACTICPEIITDMSPDC
jgi:hypothetical protein